MSDVCFCNEGGICHPCYDSKCDKVAKLEQANKELREFIKGLEKQTDCQMQNFMVQAVYDRINQECKEALEEKL